MQSAQRESNSHFLHGKQMGYHYTMGAELHHYQIVKDQRRRSIKSTEPESNPHHLVTTEESCR